MFWAVNDGRTEVVKYLLQQEYSDKDVDVRENTVLDYAIAKDYIDIADLLPSNKREKTVLGSLGATNFYNEFCKDIQPDTGYCLLI